ncbi:TPA: LysE family translocator [Citrobacter farmeri]|uniref:LysE family translocator n=1 Tax=Citrobacter farmeri TaxID=67824 RepID=UPI001898D97D|nr:LysE family translocator [Citrobacter farmeri]MBU5648129.1 LysE family translocator [Pluralibacter sp. S54_ASV_43]HAT3758024.1 LysE family translocator [Citrobacter amalonaticus]HAU5705832.1 LysE family translocator [Citrobacter freundii]MBJ9133338.1 LysE family translocator [Citrobacter farmeri]MDB2167588.1 LysE family translocator [Citrobacter farmeri]
MQISAEFLLTSFIVIISPGTGAIYTIAMGLSRGAALSLLAAVGCTLGIIPHMLAAITGLAAIFYSSEMAFSAIKYVGVLWLLYMAWNIIKEKTTLQPDDCEVSHSGTKVILHAIFINLLNPKLSLFFLAFLPQFVQTTSSTPATDMLILSMIFMLMTLFVFMLYGVFSSFMRRRVLSHPVILSGLRILFSCGFVSLAVNLFLTQRGQGL